MGYVAIAFLIFVIIVAIAVPTPKCGPGEVYLSRDAACVIGHKVNQ